MNIETARLLAGAKRTQINNNVSNLYRGQIYTKNGETRTAYIKDLSAKELCNELIGFLFARLIGLPIPDSFLTIADPLNLSTQNAPKDQDGNSFLFASADVKQPACMFRIKNQINTPQELVKAFEEWSQLGEVFAFDTWLANVDRHLGNVLLGNSSEFWIIDHGYCFSGPNWSIPDLKPSGDYKNRLSEILLENLAYETKMEGVRKVDVFCNTIDCVDVAKVLGECRVDNWLSSSDIESLTLFLEERRSFVPQKGKEAFGISTMF